jgi:chloramphenicol-sensitive protein RarD
MRPGVAYALLAYVAWGLFPLYFRHLAGVGAFEIVLHRIAWSLIFLLALLAGLRRWKWLAPLARQPRVLAAAALSALLLAGNWTLYVWAVMNGRVIDASLGYFINPLVNVLLGFVFLHERLRHAQWVAVALAALGVAWLALRGPQLPWIGVSIAFSFGLYGLLRKTATLDAIEGLTLETLFLTPLALTLLGWWTWQGTGGLAGHDAAMLAWLVGVGPLTAVPLLLFGAGARRIPMATLGLLQYVSPTLQLMLGVWLFGEPLTGARLAGFTLIWVALAVYSLEGWFRSRRQEA